MIRETANIRGNIRWGAIQKPVDFFKQNVSVKKRVKKICEKAKKH
jgi:hypothetical protein